MVWQLRAAVSDVGFWCRVRQLRAAVSDVRVCLAGYGSYGPPPGWGHGARVVLLRAGQEPSQAETWVRLENGARVDQSANPHFRKAAQTVCEAGARSSFALCTRWRGGMLAGWASCRTVHVLAWRQGLRPGGMCVVRPEHESPLLGYQAAVLTRKVPPGATQVLAGSTRQVALRMHAGKAGMRACLAAGSGGNLRPAMQQLPAQFAFHVHQPWKTLLLHGCRGGVLLGVPLRPDLPAAADVAAAPDSHLRHRKVLLHCGRGLAGAGRGVLGVQVPAAAPDQAPAAALRHAAAAAQPAAQRGAPELGLRLGAADGAGG